jgi:hypothetical protein
MEITIKVTKILEPLSGVSSRNGETWVKNSFVGETQGQYPKTLCFTVMGQERWDKMAIKVGGNFSVSFDPESREWNGKYFTDLSAWKAVNLDAGQSAQTQQPATQAPATAPTAAPNPQPAPANGVSPFPTADAAPAGGDDSDLPF